MLITQYFYVPFPTTTTTTTTTPIPFTTTTTTTQYPLTTTPFPTTTPVPLQNIFVAKFNINEIVYDSNATIWKIVLINNTIDNIYYHLEEPSQENFTNSKNIKTKIATENEIFKIQEGPSIINNLMDKKIAEYNEMLDQVISLRMNLNRKKN